MNKINPAITLRIDHIFHMTDDTGMFQHSIYGVPNLSKGYTSDDNARALIMAVKLLEKYHIKRVESLIYRYVSFLCNAQNENGTFRNFMNYNREFITEAGSEDCFGRCVWALCFAYASSVTPQNVKKAINDMIQKALPNCLDLGSPRAKAYVIIGVSLLPERKNNDIVSILAGSLVDQFDQYSDPVWQWFENSMTYGNAVLPWAMFCASRVTDVNRFRQIGYESLQFLENKTFNRGHFRPIGCNGWLQKNGKRAEYDEQPVEACETALAFLEAYNVTGNKTYLERAKTCFSWYYGNNSKNLSMIDAETGGCYDGIESDGLNLNQGAESVISFWIAYLSIHPNQINVENEKTATSPGKKVLISENLMKGTHLKLETGQAIVNPQKYNS